jgi:hypothetical protein
VRGRRREEERRTHEEEALELLQFGNWFIGNHNEQSRGSGLTKNQSSDGFRLPLSLSSELRDLDSNNREFGGNGTQLLGEDFKSRSQGFWDHLLLLLLLLRRCRCRGGEGGGVVLEDRLEVLVPLRVAIRNAACEKIRQRLHCRLLALRLRLNLAQSARDQFLQRLQREAGFFLRFPTQVNGFQELQQ